MTAEIQRTQRLREIIGKLATDIGERNLYQYHNLKVAASFIESSFQTYGYAVSRQIYEAKSREFSNLETQIVGTDMPHEIIILGAHYDTHRGSPGANDNGSAIAAILELARAFRGKKFFRTLRFVAFTNEESPFTRKSDMGSRVYARRCRQQNEKIIAMICLETIGFYSERKGSQRLSLMGMLLPRQGNFIALVGNRSSRKLLHDMDNLFHNHLNPASPKNQTESPAFYSQIL